VISPFSYLLSRFSYLRAGVILHAILAINLFLGLGHGTSQQKVRWCRTKSSVWYFPDRGLCLFFLFLDQDAQCRFDHRF